MKNLSFTLPHILKTMTFSSFLKDFHTFFRQTFCYAYAFPLQFFFLFLKVLHLVLYLTNFIMIDLPWPLFLRARSLCDLSISFFSISSPIFSLIVSMTSSSAFSFLDCGKPWIRKQLFLEYYSCLFKKPFKYSIVADISLTFFCSSLIIFSFSALSRSYSSFFSQIINSFI